MSMKETHLGDGLYASFDGFAFTLRAPREGGDHYVVLEPWMIDNFIEIVIQTGTKLKGLKVVGNV